MVIKKRKIRRIKISAVALMVFTFSFALYLFTSLFLRNYNVSLSKKIQKNNTEITEYTALNQALELDIQQLSSYDRVMAIANDSNMALYKDNIITVTSERN